jgi:hypothetical protein
MALPIIYVSDRQTELHFLGLDVGHQLKRFLCKKLPSMAQIALTFHYSQVGNRGYWEVFGWFLLG